MEISEIDKRIICLCESIKQSTAFADDTFCKEALDGVINDISTHEFKITVVGEFSSGKSTFLNALIGKNILPHSVNETTATLTYIHNVPKDSPKSNHAFVHLADGTINEVDIKNGASILEGYLSKNSQIDVARIVEYVDIFLNFLSTDTPVVLVDTPGLNGVAEGLSDKTLREIRTANASICLFHIRGLGKTDLDFLKELIKRQDKFFFVLNGIDMINSSEESVEEKIENFRKDISNNLPNTDSEHYLVFGISALEALVYRDKSIPRLYNTDKVNISNEQRSLLLLKSRIEEFEKSLYNYLICGELSRDFYQSAIKRITTILEDKEGVYNNVRDILESKVENCPEVKFLEKLKKDILPKIDDFKNEILNICGSRMDDVNSLLVNELKGLCNKYNKDVNSKIELISPDDNFEEKKRDIENDIEKFINSTTDVLDSRIKEKTEKIYEEIIYRIHSRIPSFRKNAADKRIELVTSAHFIEGGEITTRSELDVIQHKIDECMTEKNTIPGLLQRVEQIEKDIDNNKKEKSESERLYHKEITLLSSRPHAKSCTRYVNRKGLGRIFQCIIGKKEEIYLDDSEGELWDIKRNKIESEYNSKCSFYNDCRTQLEHQLDSMESREVLETKLLQINRKIKTLEAEYLAKQKQIIEEEKVARTSLLKKRKQYIRDSVESYILPPEGSLYSQLLDDLASSLEAIQMEINNNVVLMYEKRKSEFINQVDDMISKAKSQDTTSTKQKETVEILEELALYKPILRSCFEIIG